MQIKNDIKHVKTVNSLVFVYLIDNFMTLVFKHELGYIGGYMREG